MLELIIVRVINICIIIDGVETKIKKYSPHKIGCGNYAKQCDKESRLKLSKILCRYLSVNMVGWSGGYLLADGTKIPRS